MHGRGSAPDRRAAVVRQRAYRARAAGSRGYVFLHHAVDDYTRLAYSEQLPDERTETATAFLETSQRLLQQRRHRSHGRNDRQRPLFPITSSPRPSDRSSTVEPGPTVPRPPAKRFNRTLMTEWAYAMVYASDEARAATYAAWLHNYDHHQPHTSLAGLAPADRVHNVTGNYT